MHEKDSRTLARGLQVMDAILAGEPQGLRVVDICEATGLDRATVHRLLATLQSANYVAAVSRFRYGPGDRWASPVVLHKRSQDLAQRLAPVLADISAACGDAAFAVVREGGLSHCIARQVGSYPVQVLVIQVGTRQPLGVGAAGLALLAALPDREVDSIVELNAANLPLYGNLRPERLRLLVAATRQRGWSVIGNHATKGVLAVGRAVYDRAGQPLAGISVATIEQRMPITRQKHIARLMRKVVHEHNLITND